jgi:hypothetical protein
MTRSLSSSCHHNHNRYSHPTQLEMGRYCLTADVKCILKACHNSFRQKEICCWSVVYMCYMPVCPVGMLICILQIITHLLELFIFWITWQEYYHFHCTYAFAWFPCFVMYCNIVVVLLIVIVFPSLELEEYSLAFVWDKNSHVTEAVWDSRLLL